MPDGECDLWAEWGIPTAGKRNIQLTRYAREQRDRDFEQGSGKTQEALKERLEELAGKRFLPSFTSSPMCLTSRLSLGKDRRDKQHT